jgi:hypothetical protein
MGTSLVHEMYKTIERAGADTESNLALIKIVEQLSGIEARAAQE